MEKLFEVLAQIWEELVPVQVLEPDERGVRIRTIPLIGEIGEWLRNLPFVGWIFSKLLRWLPYNGQWVTEMYPGAVLSVPFIDSISAQVVVSRCIDLDNIRVETRDGVVYLVSITLAFKIGNIKRALLETEEYETSLCMDVQSIVAQWINSRCAPINISALCEHVEEDVAKAAIKWGCRMESLGVNSLAKHRVYSLMMND
jgi:hypothetical protein